MYLVQVELDNLYKRHIQVAKKNHTKPLSFDDWMRRRSRLVGTR